MKRLFGLLFFVGILLAMTGCKKNNKIEIVEGVIMGQTDSTVTLIINQNKVVFDTKQCRYTNGAVMIDDSVKIDYVGDLSEKQATALIIYLHPKPGRWVDAKYDPTKELKTKPMTEEEKKNLDDFVREAKKHGH